MKVSHLVIINWKGEEPETTGKVVQKYLRLTLLCPCVKVGSHLLISTELNLV